MATGTERPPRMTGVVDTRESVEAMANSCATTALAQKQRGLCCGETDCGGTCCAPACLFGETMRDLNNAAAMLRRLHQRAVDAEQLAAELQGLLVTHEICADRTKATARADALREARKIASDAIPTVHPPLTDHYGAHVAGERMVAEWIIKRLDTLIQPTTGET